MNTFQAYLILLGFACLVGAFRWRRVEPLLRQVILVVFFTFLVEFTAYLILYRWDLSAIFLYHFSSPLTFIMWMGYFRGRGFSKKWTWVISGSFLIFHVLTSLWMTLEVTNSPSNALRATLLIFLGIWSLNKIFEDLEEEHLLKTPHFWVALGVLVFYAGSYIYLGLQSWLMEDLINVATWLHYYLLFGLNLIFYSFLLISFLCPKKT